MLRLIAAVLTLAVCSTTAIAGATKDCANRKLSPVRIKWACTVVIDANPKAAFAYVARADAEQGVTTANFNALLADYSKAIELEPKLVSAYLGRALVNFHRGKFKSMPTGFDDAANNVVILADYDRAVALEPEHVRARSDRAFHLMDMGKPDLALVDYDVVVKLKPKDHTSYSGRAWAHFESGHYAEAVADYTTSIKLAGKHDRKDYAQRGQAQSLNGNDAAAVKDYDRALKDKTDFYDTKLNRSFALFNLGEYKKAAKALQERETVSDIQWKLLRLHAMDKAAIHLDPAIQALHDTLHYNDWHKPLVEYYLNKRKLDDVLALMAQQPVKHQCTALFFIGQQHLKGDKPQAAKASFENAIAICPKTSIELAAAKAALKKL